MVNLAELEAERFNTDYRRIRDEQVREYRERLATLRLEYEALVNPRPAKNVENPNAIYFHAGRYAQGARDEKAVECYRAVAKKAEE